MRPSIAVDVPWLVIAPPGNPSIRLDARLLDHIEVIGRSAAPPLVVTGLAVAGIAAAGLSLLPGGVIACAGLAYIAHDRLREARRRVHCRDLLLELGDLKVALHVADGLEAAKRIAEQLAPYTRTAAITRIDVYHDAKARLRAQAEGIGDTAARRELERVLLVGNDGVSVKGDFLHVGAASFRVADVRDYAARGANLPLPGGQQLQAALGLLVVAAEARAAAGEDLVTLAKRVADYEAWSGHAEGR